MLSRLFSNGRTNPGTWLRLGSLCLVLGILLRRFHPTNSHPLLVHGLSGVFLGMSLVLNLRYAVLARGQRCSGVGKNWTIGS